MGSSAESKCWKGRNTSIFLPPPTNVTNPLLDTTLQSQPNQDDQDARNSLSSVTIQPPRSEDDLSDHSSFSGSSFSQSRTLFDDPRFSFDSTELKVFGTGLQPLVVAEGQGEKEGEGETATQEPPAITIVEEGWQWWGSTDAGNRRAAAALGVEIPAGCEPQHALGEYGAEAEEEDGMAFWHGNGRKVDGAAFEDDKGAEGNVRMGNIRRKMATIGRAFRRLHCGRL